MKTILLITLIALSTLGSAQVKDTVQTDSVKCIESRIVIHAGALAFALFYTASNPNQFPVRFVFTRRQKSLTNPSQYE